MVKSCLKKRPKSLKTRYEVMFNKKLTKSQSVVELDDGTLHLIDSQKLEAHNQKNLPKTTLTQRTKQL